MTIPTILCGYFIVRGIMVVLAEGLPILQRAISSAQDVVQQVPPRVFGG